MHKKIKSKQTNKNTSIAWKLQKLEPIIDVSIKNNTYKNVNNDKSNKYKINKEVK